MKGYTLSVFDDMHSTTVTPSINATMGSEVTYNPLGVAGSTITAVFVEEAQDQDETQGEEWSVENVIMPKPKVEYKLVLREHKRKGGHITMGS